MKIGILGGGQLAQMIALAGIPFGYRFVVYDPSSDVCSNTVATHVQGAYDDWDKLTEFANAVDIITYEFENVCVKAVDFLSKIKTVYPELPALEYTQDRLNEKNTLQSIGIPTAPFVEVDTRQDVDTAIDQRGLAIRLKSRSGGYDGKGQVVIKTADADTVEKCTFISISLCLGAGFSTSASCSTLGSPYLWYTTAFKTLILKFNP